VGERGGGGGGGGREERSGRGRIYLNILGNLGTRHAPAGVISSPHATRGESARRTGTGRRERLSLYLLEISLVLAFIAAAYIPGAVRLCFGLPADVYDSRICFGGSLLRDAGAKRARQESGSKRERERERKRVPRSLVNERGSERGAEATRIVKEPRNRRNVGRLSH